MPLRALHREAALLTVAAVGVGCTVVALSLLSYMRELSPVLSGASLLNVMLLDQRSGTRLAPDRSDVDGWMAGGRIESMVDLEPFSVGDSTVRSPSGTALWATAFIRPRLLEFVQVALLVGRDLSVAGSRGNGEVLISKAAADAEFGGPMGAIGRILTVDGVPAEVVGVVPSALGFRLGLGNIVDIVRPLDQSVGPSRHVMLRARPGAGAATAADVQRLFDSVPVRARENEPSQARWLVGVPGGENTVHKVAASAALAAAVSIVVITGINAFYLGAIRLRRTHRESAMRWALGASMARLVQEDVQRSAGVALVATAGGGLLALWGLAAARLMLPEGFTRGGFLVVSPDIIGAAGLMVFAVMAFSSTGRLVAVSKGFASQLNIESRQEMGAPRMGWTGRGFLTAVTGLAVVMCATAMASANTLWGARRSLVLSPLANIGVVDVNMPSWRFASRDSRSRVIAELQDALAGLPATGHEVAMASSAPPRVGVLTAQVSLDGRAATNQGGAAVGAVSIGPNYFTTLGIRTIVGRVPAINENAVTVSESVARMFGSNPAEIVGQRLRVGADPWFIAGVVEDAVLPGLTSALGGRVVYFPLVPGRSSVSIIVRPASAAESVRVAVSRLNPDLAVSATSLSERVSTELKPLLSVAAGFVAAAFAAMILAIAGAYAVCSSLIEQGRRDIGVRMALGARPRHLVSWLVRVTLVYCVLGACLGSLIPLPTELWEGLNGVPVEGGPWLRTWAVLAVTSIVTIAVMKPVARYRATVPSQLLG